MASYFKPTDSDDLSMIPAKFRDHPELEAVASEAEADVIRQYTMAPPSIRVDVTKDGLKLDTDRYVYIKDYTVDADDASAHLRSAMKRAIAAVIRWRLYTRSKDPTIASDGGQAASKSYREPREFPKGWDRWLSLYDIRPQPFAI